MSRMAKKKDMRRATCGPAEAVRRAFERGYRVDDGGTVRKPDGSVQKLCFGSGGYLCFGLHPEHQTVMVHRLAAVQRFGVQAVDKGVVVRHLNHVKTDNSKENLAIGSQRDNYEDNPKEQNLASVRASTEASRKLSREEILAIVEARAGGAKQRVLAARYGVSVSTIGSICVGMRYGDITGIVYQRKNKREHGKRLSDEQILSIVDEYKAGASQGELAKKYLVDTGKISRILSGNLFANVTGIRYKSQLKCG